MKAPVSQQITRRSASNLALAFILLPPQKRAAMSALYAFCREVDDIADDEERSEIDRKSALQRWRDDVRVACEGGGCDLVVVRELQPHIREYGLPFRLFDELIQGVEMDFDIKQYPDRLSLERYCYHVASVVGLLSIEIFGYRNPRCLEYADALGKALQLTNIVRDAGEDARRGRIYLPRETLDKFGVRPEDVLEGRESKPFRAVCAEVAGWAREYYKKARALLPPEDRASMVSAELMGTVYWSLLKKLERSDFPVLGEKRVRLTKPHKLSLVLRAWVRLKTGSAAEGYGI